MALHPHPQAVHFAKVLEDELDRVARVPTVGPLVLAPLVRELVLTDGAQVVAEEQAAGGVLHPFPHLDHVLQDVLAHTFLAFDVYAPDTKQEVEAGEHVPAALDPLVQGHDVFLARLDEVPKEHIQVHELVPRFHIQLVVVEWREQGRA